MDILLGNGDIFILILMVKGCPKLQLSTAPMKSLEVKSVADKICVDVDWRLPPASTFGIGFRPKFRAGSYKKQKNDINYVILSFLIPLPSK